MNYLAITVGAIWIVVGIVGNKFTTADPVSCGGFKDDTELPLWLGRLLFIGVGAVFFILGLVGISR